MKQSDPGKWHKFAKKIGGLGQNLCGDIKVEFLDGLTDSQSAEQIASHFPSVANEYDPIDISSSTKGG